MHLTEGAHTRLPNGNFGTFQNSTKFKPIKKNIRPTLFVNRPLSSKLHRIISILKERDEPQLIGIPKF